MGKRVTGYLMPLFFALAGIIGGAALYEHREGTLLHMNIYFYIFLFLLMLAAFIHFKWFSIGMSMNKFDDNRKNKVDNDWKNKNDGFRDILYTKAIEEMVSVDLRQSMEIIISVLEFDDTYLNRIFIRVDDETKRMLDKCTETLKLTRSEVVRQGIRKVHEGLSD